MKKNKFLYFLIAVSLILTIISLADSMRTKRIVEVLNNYHEIDKILIFKDGNEYEIVGNHIEKYKDALEPRNIVSKRNGKQITENLKDKIIDIEYYIGSKKLLKSSIYVLSDKPASFLYYTFRVNNQLYTMIVNNEYRSVNKVDRSFLLEYLK